MTNRKLSLGIFILLCIAVYACTRSETTQPTPGGSPPTAVASVSPPAPCPADASWITAPNPPAEIGGPNVPLNSETNCQFYQFAYQWFFSMVQPAGTDERKFETLNLFQPSLKNQCALPKLTGRANLPKALFVRIQKPQGNDFNPVLPKDIQQASGNVALYDVNGNVVLYSVYYNELECQATSTGFKPNTIEIKTSWRVLKAADPSYYTITAIVEGYPQKPVILGLVGFHLVINTAFHPEFVWATFEHVNNAPDCTNPQSPPAAGWSFLTNTAPNNCATCLQQKGVSGCPQCSFNTPASQAPGLTGPPTNVCRVYRDGTDPEPMTGGNNNDTNRFNIDTLNKQIATLLPATGPMAVWKNYTLVGGLWTNGGVGSGGTDVQRGSLEAANTTMETFVQGGANKANCFACHGYNPSTPLTVSHIVSDLLPSGIAPKRTSEK